MKNSNTFASDRVLEEFYDALADGDDIRARRVHIPLSDVFYARAAIEAALGTKYSLDRIERAMFLEGMLPANQVFEPERQREWELVGSPEE